MGLLAAATANKTDVFLFPTGEDSSNWTEALQREACNTTAGMESAQQVYELRSAGDQESCPNYESEVREDEPENGYSTIVWRRWENIFEDIYVCDPTRAEHTCRPIPPNPGNATGGGGRNAI